jgi:hypothetical protein
VCCISAHVLSTFHSTLTAERSKRVSVARGMGFKMVLMGRDVHRDAKDHDPLAERANVTCFLVQLIASLVTVHALKSFMLIRIASACQI